MPTIKILISLVKVLLKHISDRISVQGYNFSRNGEISTYNKLYNIAQKYFPPKKHLLYLIKNQITKNQTCSFYKSPTTYMYQNTLSISIKTP